MLMPILYDELKKKTTKFYKNKFEKKENNIALDIIITYSNTNTN